MSLTSAPGVYDRSNEQQFRNAVERDLQDAVKTGVALTRLLFIDQDTQEVKALVLRSGVFLPENP